MIEIRDHIAEKILTREKEVKDLESKVSLLTEVYYKPGFEQEVSFVPLLENLPITHAFSWGKKSLNMSTIHLDREKETREGNRKNVENFLKSQDISSFSQEVLIRGRFEGAQSQITEVFSHTLVPDSGMDANFVFT
jgi:hypothetical protein